MPSSARTCAPSSAGGCATRASSRAALEELRLLGRGINPPVLVERGLADAVRALALDLAPSKAA
ncbi:hypothetical protein [Actinoplanes palleronii]|uniref:hypothetical protein n=1 Tax=Actinoplanes palleronii TaxID=113570 RepID=UPI0031E22C02